MEISNTIAELGCPPHKEEAGRENLVAPSGPLIFRRTGGNPGKEARQPCSLTSRQKSGTPQQWVGRENLVSLEGPLSDIRVATIISQQGSLAR